MIKSHKTDLVCIKLQVNWWVQGGKLLLANFPNWWLIIFVPILFITLLLEMLLKNISDMIENIPRFNFKWSRRWHDQAISRRGEITEEYLARMKELGIIPK